MGTPAIVLDSGQRFDMLVLIERIEGSGKRARWIARCDCGERVEVSQRNLLRPGRIAGAKSCGCFLRSKAYEAECAARSRAGVDRSMKTRRDAISDGQSFVTIGGAGPFSNLAAYRRTRNSWQSMLARCRNEHHTSYRDYGGRGITVCDRWLMFRLFTDDMGERPPGMTIDRRDVNGNYDSGNAKWASTREQARNKRSTKLTLDQALEILGRLEHGEPQVSVAKRMNVSVTTVHDVAYRRTWSDLGGVTWA